MSLKILLYAAGFMRRCYSTAYHLPFQDCNIGGPSLARHNYCRRDY